jgi:hypothetical protein
MHILGIFCNFDFYIVEGNYCYIIGKRIGLVGQGRKKKVVLLNRDRSCWFGGKMLEVGRKVDLYSFFVLACKMLFIVQRKKDLTLFHFWVNRLKERQMRRFPGHVYTHSHIISCRTRIFCSLSSSLRLVSSRQICNIAESSWNGCKKN